MPQTWCGGLITPIYKSGGRSDQSNYRGICVSSCLGKLFCSILNQELLEYVTTNNILHKSQIGFLPNNRTADHVFTLRTLVDKYVHDHNGKIYACFVDFRKAFDSVWHNGRKKVNVPILMNYFCLESKMEHENKMSVSFLNKYFTFCDAHKGS